MAKLTSNTVLGTGCCNGEIKVPDGATPSEIAELLGVTIDHAISLWQTRIATTDCETVYSNVELSVDQQKLDCIVGTGTTVTLTVPAGAFTSTVSQAGADALAQAWLDENKLRLASEQGICNEPDPIVEPEQIEVRYLEDGNVRELEDNTPI